MDLLNEVLKSSGDGVPRSLKEYITDAVYDSGFEIGINESDDMEKIYYALDEQTASERILAMAERFGCEISYSFEIEQLTITHKYINIFRKRGKELGIQLTLHKDIDKITIKKTVANLATALLCTGANDTAGVAVSLDGYEYDDGDFYTDGHYLKSRKAVEKWSRYVWDKEPGRLEGQDGHIVKRFTYDTVSQEELCKQAVAELKKISDTEINYEAEINRLPDGVQIGDAVNVVDDSGSLYLSARILKLETSVSNGTKKATLGDYLIRKSGISEKVEELAGNFAEAMKTRPLFTWTAYADDQNGTGISLSPDAKAYMGTAVNRTTEEPDLSDPSIFTWIKVKGEKGEDTAVLRIDSSRGTVFKNSAVSTVLSVAVYYGQNRITDISSLKNIFGIGAHLRWSCQRIEEEQYGVISSADSRLSDDGFRFTLSPEDVDVKVNFMCELIIE